MFTWEADSRQKFVYLAYQEARVKMVQRAVADRLAEPLQHSTLYLEHHFDGRFKDREAVLALFGEPMGERDGDYVWIDRDLCVYAQLGKPVGDSDEEDDEDERPHDIDIVGRGDVYLEKFEALKALFSAPQEKAERGAVRMLVSAGMRPAFREIGIIGSPLERGNYNADTLRLYDRLAIALGSPRPIGRLSIVSGEPGTGKTWLLRALIHEVADAVHVIVPAKEIGSISDPTMLTALLELQLETDSRIVLYLEDANQALVKRSAETFSVVSGLLNASDGMIGSLLNLSIVATTNQEMSELDPAITRHGRLAVRMNVPALLPALAETVYERLTTKKRAYTDAVSLARVYEDVANEEMEKAL